MVLRHHYKGTTFYFPSVMRAGDLVEHSGVFFITFPNEVCRNLKGVLEKL
jgi:hypothetical protein